MTKAHQVCSAAVNQRQMESYRINPDYYYYFYFYYYDYYISTITRSGVFGMEYSIARRSACLNVSRQLRVLSLLKGCYLDWL